MTLSQLIAMKRSYAPTSVKPSYSGYSKRVRLAPRPSSKRYAKKPSRTDIYKIVKNVLSRNVETEISSHTLALTNFNSGIDNSGDVGKLVPDIPQGSDDGNRKGSVICAKSLNVRGHVQIIQSDYVTGPSAPNSRICVRLMVVTPKRFPIYSQSQPNATSWLPTLLRNGANTQGFTGTVQDLYLPLNLDEVTVHWDQIFDLSQDFISVTGGAPTYAVSVSPDKSYAFFNFNIKCKDRKIHFLDASSTPTDFGPVLLMGYAHMDNSAPDVLQSRVAMSYVSTLKYTDM